MGWSIQATLPSPSDDLEVMEAVKAEMGRQAKLIKRVGIATLKQFTPVDTGRLQNSARGTPIKRIGTSRVGFSFYILAGDATTTNFRGMQYPPFVEYGTYKMSARRFMEKTALVMAEYVRTTLNEAPGHIEQNWVQRFKALLRTEIF